MSTARIVLLALMTGAGIVAACSSDSTPGSSSAGGNGGASAGAGSGGRSGAAGSSEEAGEAGASAGSASVAGSGGQAGTGGTSSTEGGAAGADTTHVNGGDAGAPPELGPYANVNAPAANPYSDDKAMLGKVLFWDEQMSSDNTVACGTCHRTEAGGTDSRIASPSAPRHPGADGLFGTADDVHGAAGIKRCTVDAGGTVTRKADAVFGLNVQVTRRKPPTYLDAMLEPAIFWDGRASTFTDPDDSTTVIPNAALEAQALGPPMNDAEMACEARTPLLLTNKLKTASPLALAHLLPTDMRAWLDAHLDATGTYPALFTAVYGTPEISIKRIVFAIATHERRLMSSETPWDYFMAGEMDALTPAQRNGWSQFQKVGCTTCHAPPLFSDKAFHNLGFVAIPAFDLGREEVTSSAADKGRVKTATIRNVGLREAGGLLHYGYGPGASLETVMASYNSPPVPALENTDPLIIPLRMSDSDIADVIDFMRNGLLDPRVKGALPPFDRPRLNSEQ
jgi:cytochrome c peroxidase